MAFDPDGRVDEEMAEARVPGGTDSKGDDDTCQIEVRISQCLSICLAPDLSPWGTHREGKAQAGSFAGVAVVAKQYGLLSRARCISARRPQLFRGTGPFMLSLAPRCDAPMLLPAGTYLLAPPSVTPVSQYLSMHHESKHRGVLNSQAQGASSAPSGGTS